MIDIRKPARGKLWDHLKEKGHDLKVAREIVASIQEIAEVAPKEPDEEFFGGAPLTEDESAALAAHYKSLQTVLFEPVQDLERNGGDYFFLSVVYKPAPPPVEVLSPFDVAKLYGTTAEPKAPRLGIEIVKRKPEEAVYPCGWKGFDTHPFRQFILDTFTVEEATAEKLPFSIRRAGSYIAVNTRRGAGNVILVHSVDELPLEGRGPDHWEQQGFHVRECEHIRSGEFLVVYSNPTNVMDRGWLVHHDVEAKRDKVILNDKVELYARMVRLVDRP